MGRDGNCMFRSVSDGNEEYHDIIRQKCMDYLLIEREFFFTICRRRGRRI